MNVEKLIAWSLSMGYRGRNSDLAELLIKDYLQKPGVVYQVFAQQDEENRLDLAHKFLLKIDYSELQALVGENSLKQNNGLFLGKWLHKWVMKDTSSKRRIELTITISILYGLISDTERERNLSINPRPLTDAEIDEYKAKPGGSSFKDEIIWELPVTGPGFEVYNRNDETADGLDQIGTKGTIEAITGIGGVWNWDHPTRLMQIGDLSRPGGLDTSQHKGHEDGKIFDMRPLRNDSLTGAGAQLTYYAPGDKTQIHPNYDRELTKEFIKLVRKLHPNVYVLFNDPEIAGQGEFTFVHSDNSGIHDNHLHLEFR